MPQLDINTYLPQVFWLVVTFTALFLVMWRVAVPRIADVLEARQKRLDDNLEKATEAKKEAEETLAAYEHAMNEARAQAQALINKVSAEMSGEAQKREAKLAEELAEKIAESEKQIDEAIDGAMENVRAVALEVAAAALDKLIGKAPSEKDLSKVIDQSLEDRG